MGQRFVACDRDQSFLMPPDVREWLPESHLAWFVIDAVEAMNLDAFYAAYRADGRSRPAYDPAMMVALLLYGYAIVVWSGARLAQITRVATSSTQRRSSRRDERSPIA